MFPKGYQVAQVCINGHVVTDTIKSLDDVKGEFCETCGKRTITACQKCKEFIKGQFYNPDFVFIGTLDPPSFCFSCGNPFPWTESKIRALKELIDFENNLNEDEKKTMKENIDDIISETPRTNVAVVKFKVGLGKVGLEVAKEIRKIIVDIASETAKKALFPN